MAPALCVSLCVLPVVLPYGRLRHAVLPQGRTTDRIPGHPLHRRTPSTQPQTDSSQGLFPTGLAQALKDPEFWLILRVQIDAEASVGWVLVEMNVSEIGIGYGKWILDDGRATCKLGTCGVARVNEVSRGQMNHRAFRAWGLGTCYCVSPHCTAYQAGWSGADTVVEQKCQCNKCV